VICLCSSPALAQSKQGAIAGAVTDAAGGIIPGARVTLRRQNLWFKGRDTRTTDTDTDGQYAFTNLRRGTYVVRLELPGFRPTTEKVDVRDTPVRVDAILRLPPIHSGCDVTAP